MADSQITYTVKVNYTQNAESDLHYAELKAQVLKRLEITAKQSKGVAEASFVSIAAVEV